MLQTKTGRIIKGVGGFYTVRTEDGKRFVCKARGLFRKTGMTPLPGDTVEFEFDSRNGGYLKDIRPRTNLLLRPAVANIDTLLIVIAATEPKPDLELVDKLLLYCANEKITPILVINKCDNGSDERTNEIARAYDKATEAVIAVSAETGFGMDKLESKLHGRTICFSGQSAVGKSSLLNRLLGLELKVGELSIKTERGKHTTRHVELLETPSGGLIADTPGFSMLESVPLEPENIPRMYPEFQEYAGTCRFPGCMHISEPGCSVKAAVENGEIDKERYNRYVKIANEAIEARRHRYD